MNNSKKIQFGILGVLALALVLSLTGAFDGLLKKGGDKVEDAAASVTANTVGDVSPATAKDPAAPAAPVGPTTTVKFGENEFDYGMIDQGEKVTHVYKFENTGSEPLIISNAKGSCGCTVPQWPKDPIMPGDEGEIKVVFDSKGKRGKQSKRVTITANTEPAQTFLTIKGEINAPEGEPATGITPQPIKPAAPVQ